jgi:hypothetical protein
MSWWTWTWTTDAQPPTLATLPKQCIVLDMDECLIHSWDIAKSGYLRAVENDPRTVSYRDQLFEFFPDVDSKYQSSFGIMRPGLIHFLEYCFERFEYVVLWSAGTDYYVEQVSDFIFSLADKIPHEVLARSRCKVVKSSTMINDVKTEYVMHTKPLQNLPYVELSHCFFVDDNEDNGMYNKNNHILIPAFEPDCTLTAMKKALSDRCLYDLIEWFESPEVQNAADVRDLDKSKIFKKKK